jgi:hypothetical protein
MSDVLVRATVNLPGLSRGEEVLVDDSSPYMAECLEAKLLVPVVQVAPEPEPEPSPGAFGEV